MTVSFDSQGHRSTFTVTVAVGVPASSCGCALRREVLKRPAPAAAAADRPRASPVCEVSAAGAAVQSRHAAAKT